MQRLIFTNARGVSVSFDSIPPYILWKVDGTGVPAVTTIQTRTVGQNGYTFHGNLLESREIRVTGFIIGRDGLNVFFKLRKALAAACNPLLGLGELQYVNDSGTWKIAAFVSDAPFEEKTANAQSIRIAFECPSPFWKSVDVSVIQLAYIAGGMSFPIRTPNSFGVLGYKAIIDNDSDVETPVEILMDGGSLNPVILNQTTGHFIKLAKQVHFGEQLYINTDPEFLEVSLIFIDPESNQRVKQNAYGYITHDSTLFRLAHGENRLTFRSEDENKAVRLTISFYKRYVGV